MKKYLSFIITALFLLSSVECFARPLVVGQNVVYRGTVTGLLISSVDGTALIDAANASITALADGNHQIEIYDSANRMLKGVLKAAGTTEGLSATELNVNPGFDSDISGWTTGGGASLSVAGGESGNCCQITGVGVGGTIYQTAAQTTAVGALYKCVIYNKYGTNYDVNNNVLIDLYNAGGTPTSPNKLATDTWIAQVFYATALFTSYQFQITWELIGVARTMFTDSTSFKQVTAPSTSGATIVSLKSGTVYNFAYKNASFTYNAASYYVIVKKMRGTTTASWSSPTMTANDAPSPYVVSGSVESVAAWYAMDGSATGQFWYVASGGSAGNYWQIYTGTTPQSVDKLIMIAYEDHGYNSFKIQGSTDGAAFTDIYSGNAANTGDLQTFTFPLSAPYNYIRLLCVSGYKLEDIAIYEFGLSGGM